jgi:hypothetical protein
MKLTKNSQEFSWIHQLAMHESSTNSRTFQPHLLICTPFDKQVNKTQTLKTNNNPYTRMALALLLRCETVLLEKGAIHTTTLFPKVSQTNLEALSMPLREELLLLASRALGQAQSSRLNPRCRTDSRSLFGKNCIEKVRLLVPVCLAAHKSLQRCRRIHGASSVHNDCILP